MEFSGYFVSYTYSFLIFFSSICMENYRASCDDFNSLNYFVGCLTCVPSVSLSAVLVFEVYLLAYQLGQKKLYQTWLALDRHMMIKVFLLFFPPHSPSN